MRNPTNQEIADGIVNYDIKIYRYLDKIYRPKTITHVKTNYGTKEDGEELHNDVLLKLYRIIKNDKYNPIGGSSFFTYFMSIVNKTWTDKLRKKRSKKNIEISELNEILNNTLQDTVILEDEMDLSWVKFLHKYISQLKSEDIRILWLYYLKKFSIKKIASMLNKTQEYVKLRLFRIRQKLKKWLTNDPAFDFDIST